MGAEAVAAFSVSLCLGDGSESRSAEGVGGTEDRVGIQGGKRRGILELEALETGQHGLGR